MKVKWEFENLRMNKNVYLGDFEMVKILAHAGLFQTLVDSGCECLDPIPLNASQSRLFLSSGGCVRDTRPRLIKLAINKWSLGFNILDEK